MGSLSRSWSCSGCRNTIKDDSDMLIEVGIEGKSVVFHVDHVTAIGMRLRTGFYGPYCNRQCWDLDAQPGDQFVDGGRFRFHEEESNVGA